MVPQPVPTLLSATFLFLIPFFPCRSLLIETVSVLENSELGTVVYDLRESLLRILDSDQLANVTAYAGQQDLFWPFALKDLRIVVARPLDREAICEKQKTLGYRLSGPFGGCLVFHCCQLLHVNVVMSPTSLTQVFFIRVAVQDVNDNAPTFPHVESPFITISEDMPVGEKILLPKAVDIDSQPFGVADYRIARWVQGNASHFQLNMLTDKEDDEDGNLNPVSEYAQTRRPYLDIVHSLDRETDEVYEFVLEAIDGGQGDGGAPFTGTVNILIRVRDVNDNAPEFDKLVYDAVVQENTLPQKVIRFKISDFDAGENGRIFINIVDPTHKANNLFRVSLQNTIPPPEIMNKYASSRSPPGSHYIGSLHLLEYLDAEQLPPRLRFHLIASDNGQPALTSRAEVNIDIINVNDQAPNIVFLREGKRLTTSRLVLPEVITAPESIVAEVHVTDSDSNLGHLTCRITSGGDAFRLTEVNPFAGSNSGTVTALLNFDQSTSPFVFSSYRQFTLRTKVNLDRESKAVYVVTIMCTDNESVNPFSRNSSLHISISDINDQTPKFEYSVYTGHVKENEANAPVTHLSPSPTIHVTDNDVGRNALITFSLKEAPVEGKNDPNKSSIGVSDASRFRIDPRSGRLWTVPALDADDISESHKYVFYVVATDDGVPERRSSSALVHIIVDDCNDNPPAFEHYHYNFEVKENAPAGTSIGRVSVSDADKTEANRKVRFSLRGRLEDLFLVDINRASGELTTRRPIDYEKQSSISLTVVAENEVPLVADAVGRPSRADISQAEASVVISVINVNDNRPEFVPVSPHRKHIVFVWEQLPVVGVNQTLDRRKFCESIPYKVIDKDCDPASQELCCTLELEDTFDGMFGLLEEIPNVVCVLKRPTHPQSYKVMLKARDGKGDDSLSSQMQLSVIIKNERDLDMYSLKGSPDSFPVGLKTSSGESSEAGFPIRGEDRKTLGADRKEQTVESQQQQDSQVPPSNVKLKSAGTPPSPHQMKMVSVLVSIAGIFCVLLLLIITALKCGLLDHQYFPVTKTPPNAQSAAEGEELTAIPQKHEVIAMMPSGGSCSEEYRTLHELFPENAFFMDQKRPSAGAQNRMERDGTYGISVSMNAPLKFTTNSGPGYPGSVMAGPIFTGSYQTIPTPPKLGHPCKSVTKPLSVSTFRPPDQVNLGLTNRIPPKSVAYLLPDGQVMAVDGTEFYSFSDAYQPLDSTTFSKGTKKKDGALSAEGTKVTFALDEPPASRPDEATGGGDGFGRLLKNDIHCKQGSGIADEVQEKSVVDGGHNLILYGKSTNHSSFV
uniref:Cadherin domain-containing protein n=1 Tax=Mesocestoides corti TaxID=53468 RepID=A0A5K3F6N9_MESCO